MDDESTLDFNFWPSFADLMLALVLILVLVLFLIVVIITAGTVDFSQVDKNQLDMINKIATKYGSQATRINKNMFGISINAPNTYDILISNEPGLQRITFTNKILFQPDKDELNEVGRDVLRITGESLRQQLPLIREIQIQGHADTEISKRFPSNLHLGSARAIRVFTFLKDISGIDPSEHLMSATTFGEYKPVQRAESDDSYNADKLREHNSKDELKEQNRRIEVLLFYRLK